MKYLLKKITFLKLSKLFLALFIIFFPFQIRTLILSGPLYQTGEFNFFTSTFIYLSDFFLLISFLMFGLAFYYNPQKKISFGDQQISVMILLLIVIAVILTPFIENQQIHVMTTIKLIELYLFYLLIINEILNETTILWLFFSTIAFQSLVGIFQYIIQSSIGLKILGEPIANNQTLGIAKFTFNSEKILRAYGTFAQANIFGGIIAFTIVIITRFINKKTWIYLPLFLLLLTGLIVSFSRTAIISLLTAIFIYLAIVIKNIPWKKIGLIASISILMIVSFHLEDKIIQRIIQADQQSLNERVTYINSSYNMIQKYPWGIGLGNFTEYLPDFSNTKLAPWTVQPVHNIFFLIANELGLIGGLCFIGILLLILYKLVQIKKTIQTLEQENTRINLMMLLFTIIVLGMFDHYLITSPQGLMILFLYFGLASNFANKSLFPLRNS